MTRITWDQVGARRYENGVDHGVLYVADNGEYDGGVPWNGLTTVTESPSGAEASAQYADNIKYLNLVSAEEFGATVEAFTYPDEFLVCDGAAVVNGVIVGQQGRKTFGLAYRTKVGTDVDPEAGYKLHLVYGALAAPSEKAYGTVNDSPEAIGFSWTVSTTAVAVGTIAGKEYKPTAILTISSLDVPADNLQALEDILYGTAGSDPRLPLPAEVIGIFEGAIATVTPTEPTYYSGTGAITVPTVTGVVYEVDGAAVTGTVNVPVGQSVIVDAVPAKGYTFPNNVDTDWQYNH